MAEQTYADRKEMYAARIVEERIASTLEMIANRNTSDRDTDFLRGKLAAYREYNDIINDAESQLNKE